MADHCFNCHDDVSVDGGDDGGRRIDNNQILTLSSSRRKSEKSDYGEPLRRPQPQQNVNVIKAFNVVFEAALKLAKVKNIPLNSPGTPRETNIRLCNNCKTTLAELYFYYCKFMLLSKETSKFVKLVKKSCLWNFNASCNDQDQFLEESSSSPFSSVGSPPDKDEDSDSDYEPDSAQEQPNSDESNSRTSIEPQFNEPEVIIKVEEEITINDLSQDGGNRLTQLNNSSNEIHPTSDIELQESLDTDLQQLLQTTPTKKSVFELEEMILGFNNDDQQELARTSSRASSTDNSNKSSAADMECGQRLIKSIAVNNCTASSQPPPEQILIRNAAGKKGRLIIKIEALKEEGSTSSNPKNPMRTSTLQSGILQRNNNIKQAPAPRKNSASCSTCPKAFRSKNILERHVLYTHGKSYEASSKPKGPYCFCNYCNLYFSNKLPLQKHMLAAHKKGPAAKTYPCPRCSKLYGSQSRLNQHIRTSHDKHQNPSNHCASCNKYFGSTWLLKKHVAILHDKIDPATGKPLAPTPCKICGKSILHAINMEKHMKMMHPTETDSARPFQCDQCGSVFKNKYHLSIHFASNAHNGQRDKKFKCTICNHAYGTAAKLAGHVKLHSSTNPDDAQVQQQLGKNTCGECGKIFQGARNLQRHVICKHTAPEAAPSFICEACGRGFKLKDYLVQHVRHTNCGKGSEQRLYHPTTK